MRDGFAGKNEYEGEWVLRRLRHGLVERRECEGEGQGPGR